MHDLPKYKAKANAKVEAEMYKLDAVSVLLALLKSDLRISDDFWEKIPETRKTGSFVRLPNVINNSFWSHMKMSKNVF